MGAEISAQDEGERESDIMTGKITKTKLGWSDAMVSTVCLGIPPAPSTRIICVPFTFVYIAKKSIVGRIYLIRHAYTSCIYIYIYIYI